MVLGAKLEIFENRPEPVVQNRSVLYLVQDESLSPRSAHEALVRRFLVNVVPVVRKEEKVPVREDEPELSPGDVKHFGVLARQAKGAKLIGILRMDMDNLGLLMRDSYVLAQDGQKEGVDRGTFSRKHSLSTLLSLFFEGLVGAIVKKIADDEGLDRIYAVYSGGDDLCMVGAWDAMPELARQVRKNFTESTSREDLGISASLVLVHEKYPIYLVTQKAGEALEEAKHVRDRKDVFRFLAFSVPWEEFTTVETWQATLKAAVEENTASRVLLRRIQDLHEEYKRERMRRGEWGPWIWRAAYWLAREAELARKTGKSPELYAELKRALASERFGNNIGLVGLAARWAELLTRREE